MSKPVMIEADGLCKQFGSFLAVRDVTFSIPKGEVVAFLGPNGAGKTTTMRLLTGFVAPTHGSARIAGIDVQTDRIEAAEHLGYLPENGPLYPDMTPMSLLRFFGEARGMSGGSAARADRRRDRPVCARIGRAQADRQAVQGISPARLDGAGAVARPRSLIMDEPTSGLDPNQIRGVRQLIRDLGQSKTVLVSTHILQEVEPVADRVLFIHDGKIVFDGKPARTGQPEWKPRAGVLQPDGPAGLNCGARASSWLDARSATVPVSRDSSHGSDQRVLAAHTTRKSCFPHQLEERITCGDHA